MWCYSIFDWFDWRSWTFICISSLVVRCTNILFRVFRSINDVLLYVQTKSYVWNINSWNAFSMHCELVGGHFHFITLNSCLMLLYNKWIPTGNRVCAVSTSYKRVKTFLWNIYRGFLQPHQMCCLWLQLSIRLQSRYSLISYRFCIQQESVYWLNVLWDV